MDFLSDRTIAAISTAMGASGIGIVRMSGNDSMEIMSKIFRPKNNKKNMMEADSHTIHYGHICDGDETVDEVLVMIMKAPHTYTGEDTVEIDCHGGILAQKKVLETAVKYGARPAEPGEFTKRAFLNGKMDLSQAEAVIDVINAKNEYALKSSLSQLKGSLEKKIKEIRENLIYQVAFIESALDDPEDISIDGYGKELLKKVKEENCDSLGIVIVKDRSIASAIDKVLYTEAGTEIAVASTKAYTAQVALLSVLVLAHAYRTKSIKEEKILNILEEFRSITSILNPILENTKTYENIAKEIYEKNDVFYIGRGLDYALAMEGSLKLKEISYIHSEAYAAGELKHGTISLITKDTPVFSSATNKHINTKTISNLKEVISRGAKCYLITDEDIKDDNIKVIKIKKVSMFLKPLLTIIPYQLIAYYTAKLKGCDIDKPRNLAKSVTVE